MIVLSAQSVHNLLDAQLLNQFCAILFILIMEERTFKNLLPNLKIIYHHPSENF